MKAQRHPPGLRGGGTAGGRNRERSGLRWEGLEGQERLAAGSAGGRYYGRARQRDGLMGMGGDGSRNGT